MSILDSIQTPQDRAVMVTETEALIETETKHRTLDAYFADSTFRLECPCKVPPKTGALIWKARCMIPTGWRITFTIEYDDNIVATKSLEEALEMAFRVNVKRHEAIMAAKAKRGPLGILGGS